MLVFEDRRRDAGLRIARRRPAFAVEQRPVVLDQPLQRLPTQVQPVEISIAPFEPGHDPQGLRIVVEAAEPGHAFFQRILAGMAKGRVPEVVGQRQRLGEILIEAERTRQRTRDLGHLDRMGQARAVMVAFMRDEDLRLVLEPTEGGRMDDAVAIALELPARGRGRLADQAPAAPAGAAGIGRAPALSGFVAGWRERAL